MAIGFDVPGFNGSASGVVMDNKFTALGTVTRDGDAFEFSTGYAWQLNGGNYANTIAFEYTPAPASAGFYRSDIAYVTTDNKILYLAGEENDVAGLPPDVPVGCMLLGTWSIYGDVVFNVNLIPQGNQFVQKVFFNEQDVLGIPEYVSISGSNGRMSFVFREATEAFDFLGFIDYVNYIGLYDGKITTIKNETEFPITLKNQAGVNNIKFNFASGTDYILQAGEILLLRYSKSRGLELFTGITSNISSNTSYVKITDSLGTVFTDLTTARAYVGLFTDISLFTNESFADGVYQFTCPQDSDFSNGIEAFCGNIGGIVGSNLLFEDKFALVLYFGISAFVGSTKNNIIGNSEFYTNAFALSTGDNTLGNCTFQDFAFQDATGNNTLADCTFLNEAFRQSTGNNILKDCTFLNEAFRQSTGSNILGNCTFDANGFTNSNGNNILGNCTFGVYAFEDSTGNNNLGNCSFLDNFSFKNSTGNNTLGDCSFLNEAFSGSTGNNTLGDCSFLDICFFQSTGNNTLGDCSFRNGGFTDANPKIYNRINTILSCDSNFAFNYTGRFDVIKFGTTSGQDLPNSIFTTPNLVWIRTPYSNQFIDGGSPDGDLVQALANMTNANKTEIYE